MHTAQDADAHLALENTKVTLQSWYVRCEHINKQIKAVAVLVAVAVAVVMAVAVAVA